MKTVSNLFRSTLLTVQASVQANAQSIQRALVSKAARSAGLLLAVLTPLAALQAQSVYTTPYTFTTLAGTAGIPGHNDSTVPPPSFNFPFGVAVDSGGNVYVADSYNHTIRMITPAGVVTTIAGTAGISGHTDATGTAASFNQPEGVAVDGGGNLYVADRGNNSIRFISMPSGVVSTLAGQFGTIGSTDATGSAARFNQPYGVAVDSTGNVYVADQANSTIRKIAPGGVVTTFAGTAGSGGATDATGSAARFYNPYGVAVDGAGNVYVADTNNSTIRMITPGGSVSTVAGVPLSLGSADGTGSAARFHNPYGVAVDTSGNIFVADQNGQTIRMITSGGVVSTIAGSAGVTGSTDATGSAARFNYPSGVAVDINGNVYVADNANSTIRHGVPPAVVNQVLIMKGTQFVQTSGAGAVIDPKTPGPNYGGPYEFSINVQGSGLGPITPPVVTLAAGSTFPTTNSVEFNGGTLAYDSQNQSWNFGLDAGNFSGPTLGGRDASFAFGTYGMNVLGNTFSLNFPAPGTYPANTPSLTLSGGSWVAGKYVIDVSQPLTITSNAFTNFNQNADGAMELQVESITDQFGFFSDNPSALPPYFSTYTIPGGTLTPGRDYRVSMAFYALMDKPTVAGLPSSLNAAVYGMSTKLVIATVTPPQVGAKATFYRVGHLNDLSGRGNTLSEVRDATKTGGVIYAVGNSIAYEGSTQSDTGFLWTPTGGMVPLPNIVDTTTVNPPFVTAAAITPDAAYIAGRVRADTGGNHRHAVRTTTSGLVNADLGYLAGFAGNSGALAISSDGSVMYGYARYVGTPLNRAVRFTTSGPTLPVIPFLNGGDDSSNTALHGTSADGSVMVGTSSNSITSGGFQGTVGNQAFRYVYPAGTVTAIPFLAGGNWSTALALSPDGNLSLVSGNSTAHPNGEVYLYNASGATTTSLGAPNGFSNPSNVAGMNSDGSLVAVTFNTPYNQSFIHNASGWHDMPTVLASAGVSLVGWTTGGSNNTGIFGLSADGTLLWGSAIHNGNPEGFVIEFDPGFLAGYGATAVSDFDGDGKSDILLTNTSTGERAIWLVNGTGISGGVSFGVVSTDWTFSGIGDFDGDGKADIFLTNTVTGERGIWLMNGLAIKSAASLGVLPTNWVISAVGDFDGDGKADLFLTNTVTGERGFWLMNGTTVKATASIGILPTDWVVSGTGDFDGDGKADLLLTNTVTSERAIWLVNGTSVKAGASLGLLPTTWSFSGVGDLNGDGKADIFLTNTATGERGIWLVNGLGISSSATLGVLSTDWFVTRMGDYNGDGKADIFLTNTVTGERGIWLMNGTSITTAASLGILPTNWQIKN